MGASSSSSSSGSTTGAIVVDSIDFNDGEDLGDCDFDDSIDVLDFDP